MTIQPPTAEDRAKIKEAKARYRAARKRLKFKLESPLRAIRENCLQCMGGSVKAVKYCSCDGTRGAAFCRLWPYRFGMHPGRALEKYGDEIMDPEQMPEASVNIENLP